MLRSTRTYLTITRYYQIAPSLPFSLFFLSVTVFFFLFYKNRLSFHVALFFVLRLILINVSTRSLYIQPLTEYQNWSMDTLEGLHMYNTVQNHLESHKESRKRREMMNISSFRNYVECILISFLFSFQIFFFFIICLWHICCTCATMHTMCVCVVCRLPSNSHMKAL